MKTISNPYPLVTVGALVVADDGDILLVHSPKWKTAYTIPGGKVELGETREMAVIREIWEETGLHITDLQFALVQDSVFSDEFVKPNHFVMNEYIARLSTRSSKESVVLNEEGDSYIWLPPKEAIKLSLNRELYILIDWHLNHL